MTAVGLARSAGRRTLADGRAVVSSVCPHGGDSRDVENIYVAVRTNLVRYAIILIKRLGHSQ